MHKIVIIGNGFDLAHGLKTSYTDFINYLINKSIHYNEEIRNDLINVGYLFSENQSYEFIRKNFNKISHFGDKPIEGKIWFKNNFLRILLSNFFQANWVDIESFYFKYLCNVERDVGRFNSQFENIKNHLEKYLTLELSNTRIKINSEFIKIFSRDTNSIAFVNFNYTNTLQYYTKHIEISGNQEVIHIHGELNSESNPIVFGYGDDSSSKYISLINRENNEYLLNLKRQQYNLASPYNRLQEFMSSYPDFEVFCIGHSLGLSDKTLLREIFEDGRVKKINLVYYKDREGYRSLNDNLSRIVSQNTMNKKVVNYPNSLKIPQSS